MKVVFTYLFRIPPAWKERIHPLPHPTNNLPAYSRRNPVLYRRICIGLLVPPGYIVKALGKKRKT
jgi:hypothetical protein